MSESSLPLSEALLAPLLDTAGDLLRHLDPDQLPATLRRVATFDRRGLARGVARHQLLAAIEGDETFRKLVCERFMEREEAAGAVRGWDAARAVERAEAAAARDDLPLLASALFAGRPRGYGFGLGVAVTVFESRRQQQAESDDVKAMQTQIAAADEARRRAEHARGAAEAQVQKLEAELKDERRSRRSREDDAQAAVDAAHARTDEVERELAKVQRAHEVLEDRRSREAQRAREIEAELRALRDELAEVRAQLAATREELDAAQERLARAPAPGTGLRQADLRALADAAGLAQRLADGLSGVVDHARAKGALDGEATPEPRGEGESAPASADADSPVVASAESEKAVQDPPRGPAAATRPTRRVPVPVPPGMLADAPEAVEAMVRTRNAALLVDGYNVSMEGWSELGKADQRERLVAALHALHLRTRCEVTVVFDGADVGPIRMSRRPGVRVLFSEEGEEADDVIVHRLSALPPSTPVLVVSSDGWVRTETERLGARSVPARALLRILR